MHITLDPATGAHALIDADVVTSFSVVVPDAAQLPLRASDVPAALGWPAGDGRHLFIRQDAVRSLAGERDEAWQSGFAAMLGYAREKGWLSPDGSAVQAHCTTPEDDSASG